jgi:hypothetical protein
MKSVKTQYGINSTKIIVKSICTWSLSKHSVTSKNNILRD